MTNSLRFLLAMIDPASIAASDNPSLLMVKLQLEGTDLFYDPPLDVVKVNTLALAQTLTLTLTRAPAPTLSLSPSPHPYPYP